MEKIFKRLVALLSASTVAVTMGGCSNNSKNNNSSSPTSSLISKIEDSDVENTSSFVSSFVISSEINESKDVTTEIGNTSKEEDTSSRVEDTSSRPQTSSKEESSSKGPTSSKNETTNSQNENSSNIVSDTSASNKVNKLTKKNINDTDSILDFVDRAYYTIYNVRSEALFTYLQYEYEGQNYLCGDDEFVTLVMLLNEENISNDTIIELLGNKSFEEFIRFNDILDLMIGLTYGKNDVTFLYENFVVDENKQKFLIELQAKMKKHVKDKNNVECIDFLKSFYNGTNTYINFNDSYLIDYIVSLTLIVVQNKNVDQNLIEMRNEHIYDTVPFYEYIESENGFYAKTKSKQLVK